LQAYLTANQPQAVQMGQNIAGNLQNTATQVTGDIAADQAAADAAVQASNVQPNSQLITEAAANPAQFVENPANVTAFQALENANYTGPATYEATPQYTAAENEVTNAVNNAPNINTNAGVEQLVAGQETNPTLGMENLDQLLLQGTPAAMAPIAAAEQPVQALPTTLANETTAEDQAIQQAIANDLVAPQAVNAAFLTGPNAVVPTWETALQNELSQAQTGENAYNAGISNYNQELNALQSELAPFEADIANIGGPSTINYTPPSYTPLTAAPTEANVATPQDYATEAALAQLLGTGLGTTPINPSTENEAGTFSVPTNTPLTMDQLVSGYQQPLITATNQALAAAGQQGYNPVVQNFLNEGQALAQYLAQFDPVFAGTGVVA
jgi:hypothetical protein